MPRRGSWRRLASKMTAIADAFDAVSAARPHHKPLGRAAAFEVLRKRSSTFYDPALIENFIRLFEAQPPVPADR